MTSNLVCTVTNVGLGLSIFSSEFSSFANLTLLWVYLAYIVLIIIITIILYLAKIAKWRTNTNEKSTSPVKMDTAGDGRVEIQDAPNKEDNIKERKVPAPDSKYRWMLFGFFAAINVAFMIVFIVLIADK